MRAAVMYTLIGTAKLNDIDPQAWLADILDRIAALPVSRLPELLPWNWRPQTAAPPKPTRLRSAKRPGRGAQRKVTDDAAWHVDQLCCPPARAVAEPGVPLEAADEDGGREAVHVDDDVVPAAEPRRLEERVRDLEQTLGRKTLKTDPQRGSRPRPGKKSDLAVELCAARRFPMKAVTDPRRCPLEHRRAREEQARLCPRQPDPRCSNSAGRHQRLDQRLQRGPPSQPARIPLIKRVHPSHSSTRRVSGLMGATLSWGTRPAVLLCSRRGDEPAARDSRVERDAVGIHVLLRRGQ